VGEHFRTDVCRSVGDTGSIQHQASLIGTDAYPDVTEAQHLESRALDGVRRLTGTAFDPDPRFMTA
jgi:hypothetical protein